MKKIALFSLLCLLLISCKTSDNQGFNNDTQIDDLIKKGYYTQAEKIIKNRIATEDLTPQEVYDLNFRLDVMDRIRKDFRRGEEEIFEYIAERYPDYTEEDVARWEETGALECKIIDGEKLYFHNAHKNLFRIDKDAQAKQESIKGRQSDNLDQFLGEYIPQVVKSAGTKYENEVKMSKPESMKIRYTLTVPAGEVPEGEVIRVWMPYPRQKERYSNVKLLSTSQDDYIISPDNYSHKSIYMEKVAQKDQPAVFSYELSFTSKNVWYKFRPEDVKPYDKESELYKRYTAERERHIIFTPDIKRITDSVTAGVDNPYLKSVKIFDYISKTYPWASAREYSTLENIPQYVLDNKHGDCGQVGLLFITMARYAGIPAKWQSGWMLHPAEVNLHDWAEAYFEGIGWVPVDVSFGLVYDAESLSKGGVEAAVANDDVYHFFTRGLDAFRYIVNDDFSADFYPAKIHPRSETVDFQRGEVEWRGENLYFGRWKYNMEVEYK